VTPTPAITEALLNHFKVARFTYKNPTLLSLVAANPECPLDNHTGVVVDIGERSTIIMAVHQSRIVHYGKTNIGGYNVTKNFIQNVQHENQSINFQAKSHVEQFQPFKEQYCYIKAVPSEENKDPLLLIYQILILIILGILVLKFCLNPQDQSKTNPIFLL